MSDRRIAVVTGAGSGVGRAAAVALAADGWAVVAAGRRIERLEATAELIAAAGGMPSVIPVDVSDPDSVAALFGQVAELFGRVDLLFNNAGTISAPAPFEEIDLDDWRYMVDVNLTGAFLCAQHAFAMMKSQDPAGGRIINNGSISAQVPRLRSAAYTATKHAVSGLTKSLALEGRVFGITCGQIDIGNAGTDMTAGVGAGALQADGSMRSEPTFDVADAGRAVAYMAGLPGDTNVLSMTLLAAEMPFVGRG